MNVGYVDREGRFLYATPALATLVGMTPEGLIGRTWHEIGVPPEVVDELEAARRRVFATGDPESLTVAFRVGDSQRETAFVIKPVLTADGTSVSTVVTARDPHDPVRVGRAGRRLERTYEILGALDQVILRTRDPSVILSEASRISAQVGGFDLAWVGLIDGPDGDVRIVSQAGRDEGLLPAQRISARDEPTGRGTVGTSIRENRTVIIGDVPSDPRMDPWRAFFERTGYRTAAAFPIRVAGTPIGSLVLYTTRSGHFDAAEARLFEQLVDDISSALTGLEAERERAHAHRALVASERRYRDVFNIGPHPMAVYDVQTLAFLEVNDASVAAFGYSREEFLERTLLDVLPREDAAALSAEVEVAQGGHGYRSSGTWRLVRRDGSVMDAEVTSRDLAFDGHEARLLLAVDITERRRLEAQLTEASRMEALGHLAGGVAHDFNNLLTAVTGYAEILVAELEPGEHAEFAREVLRAGRRAAELTRQLLVFARGQPVSPHAVDLNAVVAAACTLSRPMLGERIVLELDPWPSPLVVRADPGQLEQVVINLIVNARDAMPDGGRLSLRLERAEGSGPGAGRDDPATAAASPGSEPGGPPADPSGATARLVIEDTGCGMDATTLRRAFEPFYTTKPPGYGTGLGLATVHGIVKSAGGHISADSTPGTGTRMEISLPLTDEAPERGTAQARRRADAGARRTVLLADDDGGVRRFVGAALERAGHRVLAAGSVAEALALAGSLGSQLDVLLSDRMMPDGRGEQLAAELLERDPRLRVVLMSGYDNEPATDPAAGSWIVLRKPVTVDELLLAVAGTTSDAGTDAGV